MAIFNSMSLTNKGQILYAKAQAGAKLNFTKMSIGSGVIGTINPATLIALVTPKFDVSIQAITSNTANKTATISGTITNSVVTEATYICEIGLFATDPDDGEILYAYGSAGAYGDYMAPATSGAYSWNYQINAAIGNASDVTVTLSDLQYDSGVVNTNTTFIYLSGGTQKEINKSIDNFLRVYTTTNSGNAYSVTVSSLTTLTDGYPITVKFNAASTGAITVNPTGLGAKNVVDYFGNPVTNVGLNLIANLRYNATNSNFQLLGKGGGGNATAAQLALGAKATVDSGPIVGTMPINGALGTVLAINGSYTIPAGITTGGVVTQSIATKGAATITPGTSNQTIAANQYLTDVQTVLGDADLIQSNIISTANIFNVQGNATIESLGGRQYLSGSFSHTSGTQNTYTLPFTPSVIMLQQVSTGLWYMWGNHMPNINFCSLVAPPAYIGTFLYSDNVITVSSSTATSTIAWYIWA